MIFKIIMGLIGGLLGVYLLYKAYYARKLTIMKDGDAAEDVINNMNIKKKAILPFYVCIVLIFVISLILSFIF